ncbi:CoA-acylating methylmalonate-semialdehyde dehydrogenase [Gemella sp. GH3]|uniref:CoA-acylating methylmalonate-semialdehyde dehydrogenase n=1 Tax=unclassified Gemella TaxID=2624949 RepID=UPI0015D0C9F5|nr:MULTISPECIES: CoA-acylating methylmalonate-semialdehyde dehydrogenase [unclassified Gemella]MBF0714074.1 CoA-acylating methylmalonate-semialdehyde dehydrogenase [Gemella sp. GH3.1]NYS51026.1 CoA-acylating methylmalonate-semialdehyde dehydrogenase [Gemella sp. GH3]
MVKVLRNYINGEWVESTSGEFLDVTNPATEEVIAKVPLSSKEELDYAAQVAQETFKTWSKVSILRRTKMLFKLQNILEENKEELARLITLEHGKNLKEAIGEVGRGIENVENAAGIVSSYMGDSLATVATDVEIANYRYPVGVIGCITPFNFPMMVPFWMFPMALACGNTVVLKPSEKTPLLIEKIVDFVEQAGFPKGVLNIVFGSHNVVNGIIENKDIKAISFVGSEPVGKYIYQEGSKHMKRVQALTGAKNHLIVLEDADLDDAMPKIIGGAFGSAGERCMAAAVIAVEDKIADKFIARLKEEADKLSIGNALEEDVFLGPVIDKAAQTRIFGYIDKGVEEGATLVRDGRENIPEKGYFVAPTIFDNVNYDMTIWKDEIFAPVVSIVRVSGIREAVDLANKSRFANGSCLFTNNAAAIRYFRENIDAGMLGINLGVPAPIAWFPFSGWKDSFYGTLHCNGKDAVDFYTHKKVVTAQYRTNKF